MFSNHRQPELDEKLKHLRATIYDLTDIIKGDSRNTKNYLLRANAYFQCFMIAFDADDKQLALNDINRVLNLDPKYGEAYIWKFRLSTKFSLEPNDDAALRKALTLEPTNADFHAEKAAVHCFNNEVNMTRGIQSQDKVIPEFLGMLTASNNAITFNPQSLKGLFYSTAVFISLKNLPEAERYLHRMSEINPKSEWTYRAFNTFQAAYAGQAKEKFGIVEIIYQNDIEEATGVLHLSYLYTGLALLHINQNRPKALLHLNKAIDAHPTLDAYFYRGQVYLAEGQVDNALLDFDYCLEMGATKNLTDDDFFRTLITVLAVIGFKATLASQRNEIFPIVQSLARVNCELTAEEQGAVGKYMPLAETFKQFLALSDHYSPDKVFKLNLLRDQFHTQLQEAGSTERPIPRLLSPQPLSKLVGFFLSKNPKLFKGKEALLKASGLFAQLNQGEFLKPAEEKEEPEHQQKKGMRPK